jgi:poly-gamma-glutamate synthesis protein (capsule biosynthesis protein)
MKSPNTVTLFLCGDVMTGRGIDQILSSPSDPQLYESYVRDATRYVELAEIRNGRISRPVSGSYIWGDALEELQRAAPDVRLINLETSVTRSDEHWPDKGIHYRMHPANIACITSASIDCCALANNHVLDWGYAGLEETIATLQRAGVITAGAGGNLREAQAPAEIELEAGSRVLVFSCGSATSGIPMEWAASRDQPGLSLLSDRPVDDAAQFGAAVDACRRPGDLVVASIHWGANWGYGIPAQQRELAHLLVEGAGIDIVHGHSSHHPKGIEIHAGKPIIYGCGDFLNDYEGIPGHDHYRPELSLMYFIVMDARSRDLVEIELVPMEIKRFSLHRASRTDARWLASVLDREGAGLGTCARQGEGGRLVVGRRE